MAPAAQSGAPDNATLVSGLKEALAVGTKKAVTSMGSVDGYFGNQMIKICCRRKFAMSPTC